MTNDERLAAIEAAAGKPPTTPGPYWCRSIPADDVRWLIAELRRLRQALIDIANPIERLQRECDAKGPEYKLSGIGATLLSENASYLKNIARKALL